MGDLAVVPVARQFDGANYLCAGGHVKWLLPQQVSYGYRATAANAKASFNYGYGSQYADGTDIANAGGFAVTMSYRQAPVPQTRTAFIQPQSPYEDWTRSAFGFHPRRAPSLL